MMLGLTRVLRAIEDERRSKEGFKSPKEDQERSTDGFKNVTEVKAEVYTEYKRVIINDAGLTRVLTAIED